MRVLYARVCVLNLALSGEQNELSPLLPFLRRSESSQSTEYNLRLNFPVSVPSLAW